MTKVEIIPWKYPNEKVASITIKGFKSRVFDSVQECAEYYKISDQAIAFIAHENKMSCISGFTFVYFKNDLFLSRSVEKFREIRYLINNPDVSIPPTRTCYLCKNEFPLTKVYFKVNSRKYSKLARYCRSCESKKGSALYRKNKKLAEDSIELMALHKFKVYRKLDNMYKRGFDLTPDWILNNIIGKPCIYCGFDCRGGIDRIRNDLGHLQTNCVPCCVECNNARMDNFSHREFKIIGKAIQKVKQQRLTGARKKKNQMQLFESCLN